MTDSRISGFYRMSVAERVEALAERGLVDPAAARTLLDSAGLLSPPAADKMTENAIGVFGLPFAVAPNFLVNDRDFIVPMVVEEPSVVAGASSAAKLFRNSGGFRVTSMDPVLVGQVQLVDVEDPDGAIRNLHGRQTELLELANGLQPKLQARGGGARDIEYYKYRMPDGRWSVVLHLLVDTCDAMGANVVNTMCEGIAPAIEEHGGGRVNLRILSNLADRALVTATATVPVENLGSGGFDGQSVRDDIVAADGFARTDPHRAATHNKGIMNGVDAVAIATGNDWRAVEAAAHAYAARDGHYRGLTEWSVEANGNLSGQLRMPVKVGIVGGSLRSNPAAVLGLAIAGVTSARELAGLMAAVGLAQNFAALRALVTRGIQHGHMSLHARSVATAAGVAMAVFDEVVDGMIESGEVKEWKAKQLAADLGDERRAPAATSGDGKGTACGKVILLGEHAAVYDKHVLAVPLEDAVSATVTESGSDIRLTVPDWGIDAEFAAGDRVTGGGAILALILRKLDLAGRGFRIDVRSRIPLAMGLGSSAALAVAAIRAFSDCFDLELTDEAVNDLAFDCEKLTHGTPSGIDNTLAVFGQPVLFRKGGRPAIRAIDLAESPPLVVASSGKRGITRDQVAGVRSRYDRHTALYDTIFNEMDEISVAGAMALRTCDYETLGSMFNVCHGLLNALQVSTPGLEQMIEIARKSGALGAKLTGAGGGGSIVALCPGKTTEVAQALHAAGYHIVRMTNR